MGTLLKVGNGVLDYRIVTVARPHSDVPHESVQSFPFLPRSGQFVLIDRQAVQCSKTDASRTCARSRATRSVCTATPNEIMVATVVDSRVTIAVANEDAWGKIEKVEFVLLRNFAD